jgi:hypothetical protein
MQEKGHTVFFTCRDKEFEIYLLHNYNLNYKSFGKKYNSRIGKLIGLCKFDIKEVFAGLDFKPDIFLSHGSMYAAHAAFLLRKPHISVEDTGNWEQVRLYLPFTKCVLTSDNFPKEYGKKQIRLRSHNEIAYLHPMYFQPDPSFKLNAGLGQDIEYIVLRFVAWNATHDKGQRGLSYFNKLKIVEELSKGYRVIISSEGALPTELEKYRVTFAPHEVHDALYNASLFVGEGTTMAMESAILGTPSVYINTLQYSNILDMEKYGLLFNYSLESNLVEKIVALASVNNLKASLQEKRKKMLADKINYTSFLVWFIEHYPESIETMKSNPEFQNRFK